MHIFPYLFSKSSSTLGQESPLGIYSCFWMFQEGGSWMVVEWLPNFIELHSSKLGNNYHKIKSIDLCLCYCFFLLRLSCFHLCHAFNRWDVLELLEDLFNCLLLHSWRRWGRWRWEESFSLRLLLSLQPRRWLWDLWSFGRADFVWNNLELISSLFGSFGATSRWGTPSAFSISLRTVSLPVSPFIGRLSLSIFVVLIILISTVLGFIAVLISLFAVSFFKCVVFVEISIIKLTWCIVIVFVLGGFVVLSLLCLPVRLIIPFFCLVLVL